MTRHFLDIDDLSTAELDTVLDTAADLKAAVEAGEAHEHLENQTLGMLFEKPSTRTRISFETGMTQLGGHAIFLGPEDIQLSRGEPLKDTSRAVSRYVDFLMARVFEHADLVELAEYADVPVVNGLTDDAHPCQTLADLLTIKERFDGFEDVSVAWVGDGNNVAQSFVLGAAMVGLDVTVATPEGYEIAEAVIGTAAGLGQAPETTNDPDDAVAGADVVYTDVWVSMGQEDQRAMKLEAFDGFQLNETFLDDDTLIMHCLPAHRGEEITDAVIESDRSIVWQQAENRMHAQKALLTFLADAE
ncbi:ornithine carbamoyltransferase [Haladaptatus sp. CMSO5]|uniref:ornithine carbamoyltransferase n=1 Tax=Haladaptatus sp. CMSO5 TaxID=3120514 RepID=UPI002FCDF655